MVLLRGRLGSQSVVSLEYTQTAAASLYRQCLHHVWFRSIPIVTKTLGASPQWQHNIGHTHTSSYFLNVSLSPIGSLQLNVYSLLLLLCVKSHSAILVMELQESVLIIPVTLC